MYLNLQKVMRDKKISIEAMAALLGMHRNTIANRLSGDSVFPIEEALRLKSELFSEYDLAYLFET